MRFLSNNGDTLIFNGLVRTEIYLKANNRRSWDTVTYVIQKTVLKDGTYSVLVEAEACGRDNVMKGRGGG